MTVMQHDWMRTSFVVDNTVWYLCKRCSLEKRCRWGAGVNCALSTWMQFYRDGGLAEGSLLCVERDP